MPKAQEGKEAGGDDTQLKADVKAFAAQLGLAAAGFSDGAFDDFAPEKASKRIGAAPKASSKKQRGEGERQKGEGGQPGGRQERRSGAASGGGGRQDREGGRPQQQQDRRQGYQQRDGDADGRRGAARPQPQQRSWQQHDGWEEEAAGPKIPNAKSILPKDEPTIWFEAASTLAPLAVATEEAAPDVVQQRRRQAERLLLVEEQAFEQNMSKRSSSGGDAKWLQQVRRSGTTSDKVAAMSVLVQDGAVANLHSLDGLLAMCSKKGGARAVVGSAMDALKELFTTVLLPDRKLRFFEQQPLAKAEAGREGERRLIYWLLEDGIKKRYASFVEALEACSRDNLEFVKDRAIKTMFDLLAGKPEGEGRLLSALVNKLGDPDRKLASKVGYLLTRLLAEHPGMNVVVVREIERFMFRPGLQERARYYAVVYLNQMVLHHKQGMQAGQGGSLAKRLIDVYFTVFKMILDGKIGTAATLAKQQQDKAADAAAKKKRGEAAKAKAADAARAKAVAAADGAEHSGEMDGRMLSALITGVRRAFPYVPADEVEPLIEAHADALFRLVHARSLGVATQALLLLFQLMSSRSTVSDRFYRALYAVMGSPELYRSTKAPMFLSLLFKALKADISSRRASAFAKRLLQLAQEAPPHFACGCLLLTSELLKARPALWGAVLQPEESEADALERFQDAPEDGPAAPAAAQQAAQLLVGGKTLKGKKQQAAAAQEDEAAGSDSEAAEEEEDSDAELAGSEEEEGSEGEADLMPGLQQQQQAAAQRALQQAVAEKAAAAASARWPASKEAYDMHKREPQFSNAERSCLWELTSLAAHVHPSVAAMARTLLAGQSVMYDGDPLRDLTLGAFLEKFVQKKAKASAKGDSAMQPLAAQQAAASAAAAAAAASQPWAALAGAQAGALAALAEKDVRPDDMFFHKYYSLQAVQDAAARRRKKRGKGAEEGDEMLSDADSDDSEAADDFLAGEEEGGDDGIGANPDRSGMDYDYASLAAAMDSDSDDDSEAGGAASASGSDIEEGDSDGEEEESGSGEEDGGSGFGEEPEGATFSDMSDGESGSDGEEDEEAAAAGAFGSSEEDEEEGAGGSGSDGELSLVSEEGASGSDADEFDSEGAEDSESEDGFDAELASAGEEVPSSSEDDDHDDDEDDAAADAEVAALLRQHGIKPLAAAEEDEDGSGSDADLNAFELAEASSSEDEDDAQGERSGKKQQQQKQQKTQQKEQQPAKKGKAKSAAEQQAAAVAAAAAAPKQPKRKKSADAASVFASADDYATMIEQDLAAAVGLDDGRAVGGAGGGEEPSSGKRQRGGSAAGRAPKRQQQAGRRR